MGTKTTENIQKKKMKNNWPVFILEQLERRNKIPNQYRSRIFGKFQLATYVVAFIINDDKPKAYRPIPFNKLNTHYFIKLVGTILITSKYNNRNKMACNSTAARLLTGFGQMFFVPCRTNVRAQL